MQNGSFAAVLLGCVSLVIFVVRSPDWVLSQYLPLLNIFLMSHSETRIILNVMVSSSQIREQLAALLARRIDLDSFEDWLVKQTWNIHLSGSPAAEDLTFAIEESLSEYSSGHLSEPQLHEELEFLIHGANHTFYVSELEATERGLAGTRTIMNGMRVNISPSNRTWNQCSPSSSPLSSKLSTKFSP